MGDLLYLKHLILNLQLDENYKKKCNNIKKKWKRPSAILHFVGNNAALMLLLKKCKRIKEWKSNWNGFVLSKPCLEEISPIKHAICRGELLKQWKKTGKKTQSYNLTSNGQYKIDLISTFGVNGLKFHFLKLVWMWYFLRNSHIKMY